MKVLHLISGGDKGGAKTHVFTLLSALKEEIDIKVVCFTNGVFYQEIQNMPIDSELIKQRYRNDLSVIKKLVKLIRSERYNLIHAHGARANFIAMFLKLFISTPIVTTIHSDYKLDFTENLYKKYIYTWLNTIALKFIDYYIAVSENFKNMLIERGFKENLIYTVYNTIDFEKELNILTKDEFIKKHKLSVEDKTIIGIIGRFDYVKGHEVFINAAAQILKTRKDVIFLLAGEGIEKNNLVQQTKKLGISKNVFFIGFIEDIYSFINIIDINVLSSYSESFPYVLLEGARLKKATVSTNVGGISDLIIEGETGLLVKSGDYRELSRKILKLIEDKNLREVLGNNLYNFAKSNFSKESMKNRHIEIYKDILKKQKDANKLFDVVLSGYYGFNNSGDDALLKAVIDSIRKEKEDIKILVLSRKPKDTMQEHNVFSINRYNFFTIIRYFRRSRVFINGGGSIIQDITSTQSLIYYTVMLKVAKACGLKLMIYANGIGPITKKYNEARARNALSICDYISLREPQSLNEIKRLHVRNKNINLSVDPVFAIDIDDITKIDNIIRIENIDINKNYFVVSCRSWKYNEDNFVKKMAYVINKVNKKYNIIPMYVPMHPNDSNILREIANKSNTEHVFLSKVYDVKKLLSIISISKLTISMRLHTLIYSVSSNLPVIGLVYDPKVKFFIEYINQDTFIDTSNMDVEKLLSMIENILINYEEVKEEILKESLRLKALARNDAKVVIKLLE